MENSIKFFCRLDPYSANIHKFLIFSGYIIDLLLEVTLATISLFNRSFTGIKNKLNFETVILLILFLQIIRSFAF